MRVTKNVKVTVVGWGRGIAQLQIQNRLCGVEVSDALWSTVHSLCIGAGSSQVS